MGICCSDRGNPSGRKYLSVATCSHAFAHPAQPVGASSSGVRLFKLVPKEESSAAISTWGAKHTGEEWLGKDVAQSFDELEFYDEVLRVQSNEAKQCQWRVFDYCIGYYGVIRSMLCGIPSASVTRERVVDLLVFRSPLEGLARPRLLNMEVGPRSSALQYRRGSDVETVMFARQEGIRIEGFLAPPQSLASEDPSSIEARGWAWGECQQRRAKRLPLQRLRLGEALSAFVDLRDAINEERLWPAEGSNCPGLNGGTSAADAFAAKFLGPAEYAELALLTVVQELTSLVRACEDVPYPQKWVGSSVGLFVEAGVAPPRTGEVDPRTWVSARVKLRLFGWNRSRVTTSKHSISPAEHEDHATLWQIYQDSLAWILWEASRLYFHAFCAHEWTDLRLEVCESPGKGDDVLIGVAEIRLSKANAGVQTLQLTGTRNNSQVTGRDGKLTELVVHISYSTCPSPSRLSGLWRVQVDRARHLPVPKNPTSPPPQGTASSMFVTVGVQEQTSLGNRRTSQRTRSVPSMVDPAWGEDFEFPVVEVGGPCVNELCEALGYIGGEDVVASLAKHMPPPVSLGSSISKSNEDTTRLAATGQMAFMNELRESWFNSAGILEPLTPMVERRPSSALPGCFDLLVASMHHSRTRPGALPLIPAGPVTREGPGIGGAGRYAPEARADGAGELAEA